MYKILVVDDSNLARVELGEKLKKDGYEVLYASNGKEAIDMTMKNMPDIIVMDIVMPVMDGIDALLNLKQATKIIADIPVIVCSSKDNMSDYETSLQAGAVTHIKKPVVYERLKKKIEELVSKI